MSCGRCRVLLVDDEPMVVSAITTFLTLETDHEVISFNCPRAALGYLDEHHVDVVIGDLVMSSMSGEDFFAEVERRHPNLPRLLLTGCCDEQRMKAADALGLSGCLDKPWCNDELRRLIETVVVARGKAREQRADEERAASHSDSPPA